ncbi:laccase, multicopper oxidase, benzenediol:oxygen oxidorectuctase, partial [Ascosphaera atra]
MAGRGVVKDDSCENNATSRGCWGDYSIDTDYYAVAPETNVTREYWLVAENKVLAPDGVDRPMMVWNGSFPGPLIEANWGDNVIVHVTNNLKDNGTTVHWHGLRQLRNNEYDGALLNHSHPEQKANFVSVLGVPGATQCPIPPGESMTYRWRATQYGTTWYHSHFSLQFSEGLYGPLVIHGPATADYDIDLGPVFIQDWYHQTAFTTWAQAEHQALGVTVSSDTGLINGKNMWQGVQGQYEVFKFEQGNKYRLRIIGVQTDSWMRFAIDNHDLTVIATDLVPI